MSSGRFLFLFLLCLISLLAASHGNINRDTVTYVSVNPGNEDIYNAVQDEVLNQSLFQTDSSYFTDARKIIAFATKVFERPAKVGFVEGEITGLNITGEANRFLGDYPRSLDVNSQGLENPDVYDPVVIMTTRNLGNKIKIAVKDNRDGIPYSIKDKILQPFFTTKPTGQGKGLGLSLSYDKLKVHGGKLNVETTRGKGSEFIIKLPFNFNL